MFGDTGVNWGYSLVVYPLEVFQGNCLKILQNTVIHLNKETTSKSNLYYSCNTNIATQDLLFLKQNNFL